MRPNVLKRSIVGITTVVGLTAGTLAGASTGFAAPPPATSQAAVSAETVSVLANNFGLSSAQAKNVQRWLATYWNYTGAIDGQLGPNSWRAFQRCLQTYWGYTGAIDGDPGPNTIKALQRLLKEHYGYGGAIDGIAGEGTKAAFKRFADALG